MGEIFRIAHWRRLDAVMSASAYTDQCRITLRTTRVEINARVPIQRFAKLTDGGKLLPLLQRGMLQESRR